ncbi:V-type ATP synthase subunit A, partial [Candidatus Nitrosopelagicus sp.]|nr:V-type ATP synthase subunit A [Candidatus Nitrosopelagicus sp.]
RYDPTVPLLTGQRVIDTFFPLAKGGTGSIPGAFGTGKTVTLHQIAKWADSQVVVYIGCGERGNEMTEVLVEFPELKDPRTGKPLMDRTVLVANTSNMPVAAREASIYTGVTIAEYYRDMGYDVVLVADSTSRWAEALREMSGRLEEMPAEEGYPSYLASRLAEFYERAGRVQARGSPERDGSVSLVGAVSPSGGDFTEPVTTHTMRFIKTFWALDASLAYSRHYPSINWMNSYSGYLADIAKWWSENISKDWLDIRSQTYGILQREDTLKEIVKLLGPEALPDEEKLILEVARMIKIGILQQNSFDDVDTYCSPEKQFKLMKLQVDFYNKGQQALKDGASLADIRSMNVISLLLKARMDVKDDEMPKLDKIETDMIEQFNNVTGVKVQN